MTDAYPTLIRLLLPAGILEYFELVKVDQSGASLNLYLEEKNIPVQEYEKQALESRGFLAEVSIQDFPIHGQKIALRVKRRRWQVKSSGVIITRDWNLVQKGTRLTTHFF